MFGIRKQFGKVAGTRVVGQGGEGSQRKFYGSTWPEKTQPKIHVLTMYTMN